MGKRIKMFFPVEKIVTINNSESITYEGKKVHEIEEASVARWVKRGCTVVVEPEIVEPSPVISTESVAAPQEIAEAPIEPIEAVQEVIEAPIEAEKVDKPVEKSNNKKVKSSKGKNKPSKK